MASSSVKTPRKSISQCHWESAMQKRCSAFPPSDTSFHLVPQSIVTATSSGIFARNECGTSSAMATAATAWGESAAATPSIFHFGKPQVNSRWNTEVPTSEANLPVESPQKPHLMVYGHYSPGLHYAGVADEMTTELDVGIKCCLCCTRFIEFDKTESMCGYGGEQRTENRGQRPGDPANCILLLNIGLCGLILPASA